MPRFDGTGPRGLGPLSGRGEGYCVVRLPEEDQPARGFAGLGGWPIGSVEPAARWVQRPSRRLGWPAVARRGWRFWRQRRG
jgi:hypothetical protein